MIKKYQDGLKKYRNEQEREKLKKVFCIHFFMQKNEKIIFAVNHIVRIGPKGAPTLYVRIPRRVHHRVKPDAVYRVTLERIDAVD